MVGSQPSASTGSAMCGASSFVFHDVLGSPAHLVEVELIATGSKKFGVMSQTMLEDDKNV